MRKNIHLTLFIAAVLVAVTPAGAGWDEGVAAFKAGNYAEAATHFQELVETRTDCAVCFQMYGQTLLKLGRNQEAVTQYRKAYDLTPDDNNIRLPLAQAYVLANRYGDAVKLLETIDASTLPKAKQQAFYQLRAVVLEKTGRDDAMLEDLRRLASANPNDAQAQYQYGHSCLSGQDTACAVPALRNAVRLEPSNTDMKRSLVNALMLQARQTRGSAKLNAYKEAVRAAQQLVASSSNFENLMLLGEAQLGAKEYSGAATAFQRATEADSSNFMAFYYLGQAQTSTQRYEAAEATLKNALTKAGDARNQTLAWKQLGFVYEKKKLYSEAIDAYRKVGDSAAAARVEENKRIAEENTQIEDFNKQVEDLEKQKEELKKELENLPPDR